MQNTTHPSPSELNAAFFEANASLALEGLTLSPSVLAIQQAVIDGEFTFDQAIQAIVASVRGGH
jgi:hypothetical protein